MKLLTAAAAAFMLAASAASAQPVYPAPTTPTTANPVFLINPGNGTTSGGIANPNAVLTGTTTAYAAGNIIGGMSALTVPTYGLIANAELVFRSGGYVGGADVLVFDATPTGGGLTDHAALAVAAVDMPKLIGVLHLTDCKLTGTTTSACQTSGSANMLYNVAPNTVLTLVTQVSQPLTLAAAQDVTLKIKVAQ